MIYLNFKLDFNKKFENQYFGAVPKDVINVFDISSLFKLLMIELLPVPSDPRNKIKFELKSSKEIHPIEASSLSSSWVCPEMRTQHRRNLMLPQEMRL